MYSRRQFLKTTATAATGSLVPLASLRASVATAKDVANEDVAHAQAYHQAEQVTKLELDAPALYKLAITRNISLTSNDSVLLLDSGKVFQDDGPAAGYSYKPNLEKLSSTISARKQLVIEDLRAGKAILMVSPGGPGLNISVNGHPQVLGTPGETGFGQWQTYPIHPAALRSGVNDVVLSGIGELWIARADDSPVALPHRSARSTDSGVSWSIDRLGPDGTVSGEYYVRVFLEQYCHEGSILLPVMDAGNLSDDPLGPPIETAGPLQIFVEADVERQQQVSLRVRSGTTYLPADGSWTEWILLDQAGILKAPRGRYFQVDVTLSTDNPLTTPTLRKISIHASPVLSANWTKAVIIQDAHNERIIRTSIPFRYEPFTEPKLKELHTLYHLDEVAGDAKTELDLLGKLAAWSVQQWKWEEWHLDESYPPWDALEILRKGTDGKPVGGFCEQYDVVFLQAAESFGFVGRQVSISNGSLGLPKTIGHEPTEIWSNEFRKWIYVDGTYAAYIVDDETGIPFSLFEVRERQIQQIRGEKFKPARIVHLHETVLQWRDLTRDLAFAELRLIPRSNFLEQKSPLPLNAGFQRAWFWSGYYVWTDAIVPAELLHVNRVTQHNNFEWTLNQAHYMLEAGSTPGEIRVHLDTETPGFESFLAEIDGAEKRPVDKIFAWKLHTGSNRMKVWPRNNAGRDGIASWIQLEWPEV